MAMLLVWGLVVMAEMFVCMEIAAVVVLMGDDVSAGGKGDVSGVGSAGTSAEACDDGGIGFGIDHKGCVLGDAYQCCRCGFGNDGVGVGVGIDDGNGW